MKCIFQLIAAETGERSEAMTCEREQFRDFLLEMKADPETKDFETVGILCLMENHEDEAPADKWLFSKAPFMRAQTFCDMISGHTPTPINLDLEEKENV